MPALWLPGICTLLLLASACEAKKQPTGAGASSAESATTAGQTRPVAARPPGRPTGTFLDRQQPTDLRLVTYNVLWNSVFADVNAELAARFARVIVALDPDILGLQEIGVHPQERRQPGAARRSAADVAALLNTIAPLPGGASWHAFQGSSNVIASRYALKMTRDSLDPPGQRELAMALVDLPDERFGFDFYVLNNHYKCCDPEQFDPLRQQQSDAIVSWLRDARTPGGKIDLPAGTAIAVVGDLNIVGSFQPVTTLLEGDIKDEERYGPDFVPDWDDTPLVDARPLHNIVGPADWTWRDDEQEQTRGFKPGRLDFIIYTDSVLTAVQKFVLNTTTMSEADLRAAGLEKFDVAKDDVGASFDHLPVVVDFRSAARGPS